MRTTTIIALCSACYIGSVVGCGDESSNTSGSSGSGGGSTSSTTTTATTTTSSSGTTTSTTTTTSSGTGGSVPDPCDGAATPHLLISEVATQPNAGEYIELWNPGSAAVDLSNYYLSDNGAYYTMTSGSWTPNQTAGTDFVAKFPAGTSLGPDALLTIATGTNFEGHWGTNTCPDFVLSGSTSCNGKTVPPLEVPTNGSVGATLGSILSNDREMLILFCWGDHASLQVHDVDYLAWGDNDQAAWRVDKTGKPGYAADTAMGTQDTAPAYQLGGFGGGGGAGSGGAGGGGPVAESVGRCDGAEDGESISGGNGILGHDETSEQMGTTFELQSNATPGAKNSCN